MEDTDSDFVVVASNGSRYPLAIDDHDLTKREHDHYRNSLIIDTQPERIDSESIDQHY